MSDDGRDEQIAAKAAEFIAHHEGLCLCAYPDPASDLGRKIGQNGILRIGRGGAIPADSVGLNGDPWTIGYGQTGKGIKYGLRWTEQQAIDALRTECDSRWKAVRAMCRAPLAIPQAVALVSFAYNLGNSALENSTLLRKLNLGDYSGAAKEFDKWVNAGGRRMAGLVTRRAAERAMFESALIELASAPGELRRVSS